MFTYIIADKTTGEIVHCYMDENENSSYIERVKVGDMPISFDGGIDPKLFEAIIINEEHPEGVTFGAKKFREEFKVFKDASKSKGFRLEKRAIRGKTNEVDGTIVDDPANYDAAVAASKAKEIKP